MKILHTSDIHCFLQQRNTGKRSGFLYLASLLRKEYDAKNTLLIDCGDSIQRSFIGMVSKGAAAGEVLNSLHYDVWVPGNHEYDFGLAALKKLIDSFNGCFLAANLRPPLGKKQRKYHIFTRQGVRIAVVGMTRKNKQTHWAPDRKNAAFKVSSPVKSLKEIMPELMKGKPHIIILAIHEGLYSSKENAIFDCIGEFPQINLVLGGHSHQQCSGKKIGFNSWYTEPGCYGEGAVKINISYNKDTGKITSLTSCMLLVNKNTPADAKALLATESWRTKAKRYGEELIGSTLCDLEESGKKSNIATIIGHAMLGATGASLAFAAPQSRHGIKAGSINRYELFSICPYENTIVTLNLNENEFRKIIAEQYRVSRKKSRARFLRPFGISNEIKDGLVCGKIRFNNGTSWKNKNQRIKTAFISYSLSGEIYYYPQLLKISRSKAAQYQNTKISLRHAVAGYIKTNSPLNIRKSK